MSEEAMLPESPAGEGGSMEEYVARLDSSLLSAFLAVMESLTAAEKTVPLPQEVFDYDPTKVASLAGGSEVTCSRIAGRAKRSVVARRPRFENASGRKEHPR